MKKFFAISLLFIILCTFFSCNKYEDGPAFSFYSAKKRLVGTYILEKQIIDDKDTSFFDSEKVTYKKNGSGERIRTLAIGSSQTSEFIWEFDKNKEQIRDKEMGLDGTWGDWTPYKKILKLTKKELWLLSTTSQEIIEYHYKKQ